MREAGVLRWCLRRLSDTAETSLSRVPSHIYIYPSGFSNSAISIRSVKFLTKWTLSPWALHGGFEGAMKSLKLPPWHLEKKSVQGEQWDIRVSGRRNSLLEEWGLFVWPRSPLLIINCYSSSSNNFPESSPLYKVPPHTPIIAKAYFTQVLNTFHYRTWLKSGLKPGVGVLIRNVNLLLHWVMRTKLSPDSNFCRK